MDYQIDIQEEYAASIVNFPLLPQSTKDGIHQFYREQIVLLFYNLTRKKHSDGISFVENVLKNVLVSLKTDVRASPDEFLPYLRTIYKMIGHTRDIFYGKGEQELAYMMITTLHSFYPTLSVFCLYKFVQPLTVGERPYGSWKDIKHFCDYVRIHSKHGINDTLIEICVKLTNKTLANDIFKLDVLLQEYKITNEKPKFREHLTNIAKWIPRENKKYDWLYDRLVKDWFNQFHPYILSSNLSGQSYYGALYKCKMKYRKLVSFVNHCLDTTEIKLCSRNLNQILPKHVPQVCFMKKKKQFFGSLTKNDKHAFLVHDMKKMECAIRFISHFEQEFSVDGEYDPNRPHETYVPFSVSLSHYIKTAIDCINNDIWFDTSERSKLLNNQWAKMSAILGHSRLHNFIPMLDMSFTSNVEQTETFYGAIGLACLIAERSSFGKRVLVIDHVPTWVNLENCKDLISMVRQIMEATKSSRFTNSNIHDAISLLLFSLIETKTSYTKIRDLKLVFLQTTPQNDIESLHNSMISMFYKFGETTSRKKSLSCPTIIYWNLCQTEIASLPGPVHLKNCVLLSGLSASTIRSLYALNQMKYNSYEFIENVLLLNSRYNVLGDYLNEVVENFNNGQ